MQGFEYNGLVSFMGGYTGYVMVSMPAAMLRDLLVLQHEHNVSEANLLDAVGEIANTLAGNARKVFGPPARHLGACLPACAACRPSWPGSESGPTSSPSAGATMPPWCAWIWSARDDAHLSG